MADHLIAARRINDRSPNGNCGATDHWSLGSAPGESRCSSLLLRLPQCEHFRVPSHSFCPGRARGSAPVGGNGAPQISNPLCRDCYIRDLPLGFFLDGNLSVECGHLGNGSADLLRLRLRCTAGLAPKQGSTRGSLPFTSRECFCRACNCGFFVAVSEA